MHVVAASAFEPVAAGIADQQIGGGGPDDVLDADQRIEAGAEGVLRVLRRQVDVHAGGLERVVGPVGAVAAGQHVVAEAAEQVVVAIAADEDVGTVAAEHLVLSASAGQLVVAAIAEQPVAVRRADQSLDALQQIVAGAEGVLGCTDVEIDQHAGDIVGVTCDVVAAAAEDEVVAGAAIEHVVTAFSLQPVIAGETTQLVIAGPAIERVCAGGAAHDVVAGSHARAFEIAHQLGDHAEV